MSDLDLDKIRRECYERNIKKRHDDDLIFKIDNMIKERADNNKHMCFRVDHTNLAYDKDGKLVYAGFNSDVIFARNDNFEGMLELHKYRDNFKSPSNIMFEKKGPNARVCDGVIPPDTTITIL